MATKKEKTKIVPISKAAAGKSSHGKSKKTPKEKKIPYHRQPEDLDLERWRKR